MKSLTGHRRTVNILGAPMRPGFSCFELILRFGRGAKPTRSCISVVSQATDRWVVSIVVWVVFHWHGCFYWSTSDPSISLLSDHFELIRGLHAPQQEWTIPPGYITGLMLVRIGLSSILKTSEDWCGHHICST